MVFNFMQKIWENFPSTYQNFTCFSNAPSVSTKVQFFGIFKVLSAFLSRKKPEGLGDFYLVPAIFFIRYLFEWSDDYFF